MEAYKLGLIDRVEALKKTEIFDKSGVLQRMDEIAKLQSQLQGAQKTIKDLSGDLQTARRETVSSKQRTEVEKFKGRLKDNELGTKSKNQMSIDKLSNAVKLEQEKLRLRSQAQEKNGKLQNQNK
jgi:hypothetical protein